MNEIATLDLSQLPSTQLGSDDAFDDLAKGADFLKYAKLYTKGKPIDTGKIPPGHWGIPESNGSITDLGEAITVVPLARRPKAMDCSDKSAIIVSYDEKSPVFKEISARSTEKDSGCQDGISFLVYEKSSRQFLEIWFCAKSHKPEAKNLFAYLPVDQAMIDRRAAAGNDMTGLVPHGPIPLTLKVRLGENKAKGFTWHIPLVVETTTPVKLPPEAVVIKAMKKFLTIKSEGVEKVAEPERKARAR